MIYRNFILKNCAEFLYCHLQTSVAHKKAHLTAGLPDFRTDGSWKSESHGAESARRDNAVGAREFEISGGEHLVLSHIGDKNGVVVGGLRHSSRHFSHVHHSFGRLGLGLDYFLIFHGFRTVERGEPFLMPVFAEHRDEFAEHRFRIAEHRHCGAYVFVEFRRVDVDMHNLCLWGIFRRVARDAVVKPHAYGYQHIALVGVDIRTDVSVHAGHAFVEWMA